MTRTVPLLAALALAACQQEAPAANDAEPSIQPPAAAAPPPARPATDTPPAIAEPQASDDWRDYAKPEDADRLRRLDGAWESALGKARKAGFAADIEKMRALADPKAATLANPHPAPGDYNCAVFKIGGTVGFVSYPVFRCRIALTPGGDLTLTKLTGSQRTAGKFYPSSESDRRLVYLGGQAWGMDEKRASAYGADPARDQIGVLERIGEQRWRLVLPWPRVESDLDLIELSR
jgi:hypothetical protein